MPFIGGTHSNIENYEQENKTYSPTLSIPKGDKENVLRTTEQQRRISKRKSPYSCRKNELNNLIRSIRKCVRGKSYREIEDRFERELSRVKKNTNREKKELDEFRTGIQEQVDTKFTTRRTKLETGQGELEAEKADLDRRYNTKRKELEREEGEFEREQEEFTDKKEKLEIEQAEVERITREFKDRREKLESEQATVNETTLIFQGKNTEARSKQEQLETERNEYESALEKIKNRDGSGTGRLSREIKDIISKWETLSNWRAREQTITKYKKAIQRIGNEDYKTWT